MSSWVGSKGYYVGDERRTRALQEKAKKKKSGVTHSGPTVAKLTAPKEGKAVYTSITKKQRTVDGLKLGEASRQRRDGETLVWHPPMGAPVRCPPPTKRNLNKGIRRK